MKKQNYKSTVFACYAGYVTQAAVNNLAPILFIVFMEKYHLSYDLISTLIMLNFSVQLITDGVSVKLCRYISARTMIAAAHFLCAAGLVMMGLMPLILPNAFVGLVISVIIYAIGGGLTEVLISPILEAIPDNVGSAKATAMSLLHSFYCWGQVAVVLLSTLFISAFGYDLWYLLPMLWAIIPLANAFVFLKVPIALNTESEKSTSVRSTLRSKGFIFILLLMFCAGACELTMSQWSSLFAQNGLHITKTAGDILGPCLFALLMGSGRVISAVLAKRVKTAWILTASGALCLICYATASISDSPAVCLAACAVCGLSVAAMWPSTYSYAAAKFPQGGTGMFGLMAFAGDIGCGGGPFIAGLICNAVTSGGAEDAVGMKTGFAFSMIYPVLLIVSVVGISIVLKKKRTKNS